MALKRSDTCASVWHTKKGCGHFRLVDKVRPFLRLVRSGGRRLESLAKEGDKAHVLHVVALIKEW